jgi:thymidylate kinase
VREIYLRLAEATPADKKIIADATRPAPEVNATVLQALGALTEKNHRPDKVM